MDLERAGVVFGIEGVLESGVILEKKKVLDLPKESCYFVMLAAAFRRRCRRITDPSPTNSPYPAAQQGGHSIQCFLHGIKCFLAPLEGNVYDQFPAGTRSAPPADEKTQGFVFLVLPTACPLNFLFLFGAHNGQPSPIKFTIVIHTTKTKKR